MHILFGVVLFGSRVWCHEFCSALFFLNAYCWSLPQLSFVSIGLVCLSSHVTCHLHLHYQFICIICVQLIFAWSTVCVLMPPPVLLSFILLHSQKKGFIGVLYMKH